MAFEIEHDWQGSISTPRARVGERVKNHLLILLCALWIIVGLVGHDPWKPYESHAISIVQSLINEPTTASTWLTPVAVGETEMRTPPLYFWSASLSAWLLSPLLPMHDAARLISGLWMALTLLMVGMTGRELWGVGIGRQSSFIFISALGLIEIAHLLSPIVSSLTGSALGFYALALAKRRPLRASLFFGLSLVVSFLSLGLLPLLITLITALCLPLLFRIWRHHDYFKTCLLGMLYATPFIFAWVWFATQASPTLMATWWQNNLHAFAHPHFFSLIKTLSWFAWPALPIAVWGLWRYRKALLFKPKFQLSIVYFLCAFGLLGMHTHAHEPYALPLLMPLTAVAAGSVESLRRGFAGLLNWFGLMLFGLLGSLIWLGWIAMLTGWPAQLSRRMHLLSGLQHPTFNGGLLAIAILLSLIWLSTISTKRSNRAAVTDWAVGITVVWGLLMTLWLPFINHAKSYAPLMQAMQKAIPTDFACINTRFVSAPQQALLSYYTHIHALPLELGARLDCDLYLIQEDISKANDEQNSALAADYNPGGDWRLIWQGQRPAERHERFKLYQIKNP